MEVKELSVVGMDYTLKNGEGELLDTSEGKQPLYYIHGTGSIIPGLEKALVGKAKGDKVSVTVAPEEGYGEKRDDLMQKLDKAQFDKNNFLGFADFNGKRIYRKITFNNGEVSIEDFSNEVELEEYISWGEQNNGTKVKFSNGYKRVS